MQREDREYGFWAETVSRHYARLTVDGVGLNVETCSKIFAILKIITRNFDEVVFITERQQGQSVSLNKFS